jgi:ribose 5-phosphate isomerase A
MTVGLGTGSTVAYLLAPLAARRLAIRCVATSPATAQEAMRLALEIMEFTGPSARASGHRHRRS